MTSVLKGISGLLLPCLLATMDAAPARAQQIGGLSPATWPKRTLDELFIRENAMALQQPAVTSDSGLVVVTSNPFAAHAGVEGGLDRPKSVRLFLYLHRAEFERLETQVDAH